MSKTATLELAIKKVEALPEAAQEQIARDVLVRVDSLAQLREDLEIGLRELDAGEGRELDIDEIIRTLHQEHEEA